ncbi:CUB and sushi domain-containing protein 3-like [Watersipora subatra]|uniref:CUB and sushi domain-containing protein 3-like n=1 Tax=Watersipora subatra TaxID=2589382 RepID=UPI00355B0E4A
MSIQVEIKNGNVCKGCGKDSSQLALKVCKALICCDFGKFHYVVMMKGSVSFGCASMPSSVANGRWTGTNVTATVICNNEYELTSGDNTLNCPSGIWVGARPVCSKISFGCANMPSPVTNGRWTGNNVTATVVCNNGYELTSGDNTLNCPGGAWIGARPVCSKISFGCTNMPSPVTNGRWTGNNVTATVICNNEYELTSGDNTLNCSGGIWVGARPVCSKISFGCASMPSPVTNGRWTGNNVTATVICNDGFELTGGDNTLNCPDGIWVGAHPICSKISFGCASMPSPVTNGRWTGNNLTATVICNDGYELTRGDQALNCPDGTWKGSVPTCSKISFGCASMPSPVTNGRWTGNNVTATVICNDGYELTRGDQVLNCPDGKWIGALPVCSKISFGCANMPSPVTDGRWTGNNVTATVICKDGYVWTSGDQVLNCPDGIWVGALPICSKISFGCTNIPSPVANGRWTGNNVTATVICNDGYELKSGDHTLSCPGGTWQGALPVCTKRITGCASPPPQVKKGVWEGNNISVTIRCIQGYELESGDKTLICENHQWNGKIPVCAAKTQVACSRPPPQVSNGKWIGNNLSVVLVCENGYVFTRGDNTLECHNNSWMGEIPSCNISEYSCLDLPPRVSNGIWIGDRARVTIQCNPSYFLASGNRSLICPEEKWVGQVPICEKNDTAEALEKENIKCPYSLSWIGLSLSCQNYLTAILIAAAVLSMFLFCCVMVAARRRERRRLILRETEQTLIMQKQAEVPRNLEVVLHKKKRSKSRTSIGSDGRSIRSKKSRKSKKSRRSKSTI